MKASGRATKAESCAGNRGSRCSLSQLIAIACFLSLSVGLFEVLATLVFRPSELVSSAVSLNLAAAVAMALVAYLVLWVVIAYPAARILRLSTLPLAVSLSVFLLVFYVVASMGDLIAVTPSKYNIARISVIGAGSLVILLGTYLSAAEPALSSKYERLVVVTGCAFPFILTEGVALMWFVRSRMELSPSPQLLLMLLAFAVAAVGTVVAVFCITRKVGAALPLGLLLVVTLAVPLRTLGKAESPSGPTQAARQADLPVKHVVLIIVDTLRADFLSCLSPSAQHTPNIDALAEDGVLFRKAFSAAPWTVPSVASIMTGLSPLVHQTMSPQSRLPDGLTTLAEYMQAAGYYTAAMGYNPFLIGRYNISQGFYEYTFPLPPARHRSLGGAVLDAFFPRSLPSAASTAQITDLTTKWIDRNRDRNFFLWTHYFDPHMPYAPPPEFLPDGEAPPRVGNSFARLVDIRLGHFFPTLAERQWIKALYGSEVRYVDENVGRVLETLKNIGIYDESLVILASDHGEEFWEHGGFEHGHSVNDELLRVPLIVKLPRSVRKGEIAAAVSTESILPTVLDICGIEYEDKYLSGRSLMPLIDGEAQGGTSILSTGTLYYGQQESLIFGDFKYVIHSVTAHEELFRLEDGFQYRLPPLFSAPEQLDRARSTLDLHHSTSARLREHYGVTGEEAPLDKRVREQLRALGYVQ